MLRNTGPDHSVVYNLKNLKFFYAEICAQNNFHCSLILKGIFAFSYAPAKSCVLMQHIGGHFEFFPGESFPNVAIPTLLFFRTGHRTTLLPSHTHTQYTHNQRCQDTSACTHIVECCNFCQDFFQMARTWKVLNFGG